MSLILVPAVAGLSSRDEGTDRVRAELVTYLNDEPGLRIREAGSTVQEPDAGKSIATDIAVGLSGPGVVAGIVRVVHLWLSRDRDRRLRLTVQPGDQGIDIEVTGENVSDATLRAAIEELLNRTDAG